MQISLLNFTFARESGYFITFFLSFFLSLVMVSIGEVTFARESWFSRRLAATIFTMRDRDHGQAMTEMYKNDPAFAVLSLQHTVADGTLTDVYMLARHLPCRDKLFEVLASYGPSFALTDANRIALHSRLVELRLL